jgi:CheY-like chemotaxis protein
MTAHPTPTRVLVIDDDPMSRELLSVLLEGNGYAVQSADSGETALALLRQADPIPDLVLTDVQMPGTTGARLAGKLRRTCGPATMLLAMSGSQPAAKAIASFDGFLMKPFKMQQVAAALESRNPLVSASAPASETASQESMDSPVRKSLSPEAGTGDAVPVNLVLNEKIYQQLAVAIPHQQLLEMYAMCLNDARERISGMRRLVAEHDQAQFRHEAHSIKGGCGMLGATELHHMAAELESGDLAPAAAGEQQDVNSLDELSAACDRLERMLRSRV